MLTPKLVSTLLTMMYWRRGGEEEEEGVNEYDALCKLGPVGVPYARRYSVALHGADGAAVLCYACNV